ncbi:MAG: ribosome recycling factor [Caldisericaceae bacterium]|nr:ribosome recycling factor [Caldisericaceae bacterium]RLD19868.1 MAG: ribosome recycling factor [Caldisericota bacterium]
MELEKKIYQEVENEMKMAIEAMEREFSHVRAIRVGPELLDSVRVQAYGTTVPLKQVASISTPKSRVLAVEPWDKSLLNEVERGILKANLGVMPRNDGTTIILPFPKLDEEERIKIVNQIKKMAEKFREEIRGVRRRAIDKAKSLEKDKEISEDDRYRMQEKIQEFTDKYIKIVNEHLTRKEEEILEV